MTFTKLVKALILTLTLNLLLNGQIMAQEETTLTVQEHFDASSPDFVQNSSKFTLQGLDAFFAAGAALTAGANDSQGNLVTRGAIPATSNIIIAMVTDPPIKSSEYIADVLKNTKLVPAAYAQGIGFSSLSPILQIWKAFRNIAYFLLIIVFVAIGIMIMFQSRIDPQTVVTVQLALPKLVLTAILITFSYAIAGFVIDLIYLSIYVIISLMALVGLINDPQITINAIYGYSIFRIALNFFIFPWGDSASQAASGGVASIVQGMFSLPDWLGWLTQGLAYFIIAVAILIALFRTLFALVMAWVSIILATIFAPIQLLVNAFPGNNMFGTWLKGLIAHAAVFPAVATMLIIGTILVGGDQDKMGVNKATYVSPTGGSGWIPPLVTTGTDQTGTDAVRAIIGLGIILLLPETVKIIRELLGVKEGFGEMAWNNAKAGASGVNWAGRKLFGASQTEQMGQGGILRPPGGKVGRRFSIPAWPF
jgi:hypothetical protein